jgi:stearoyl-CoA desaturase (Delta-9 desaturase)
MTRREGVLVTTIVVFFVSHWALAAFAQVLFLHRYASHGQFTMSPRAERFFHLSTYLVLGSSYLPPRAYAVLHRMHHAFSDTPRDPHSPRNHRSMWSMGMAMRRAFDDLAHRRFVPEPRFDRPCPDWPALDRLGWWAPGQIAWVCAYALVYIQLAPLWLWPLIAVHAFMAPIQGALVNWCGHRYGYRNHTSRDDSTNAIPIDFLVMGDLLQNNHHHHPQHATTAERWFEADPAGMVIRVLAALHVIELGHARSSHAE